VLYKCVRITVLYKCVRVTVLYKCVRITDLNMDYIYVLIACSLFYII